MRYYATGFLTLALAAAAPIAAHAATYEVSPSGSDSNPGTAAAPWKTLQKAANTVHAGDTVLVNDGTYVGFRQRTSGTAASRITFKSKNKWGAKVTSMGPLGDVDNICVLSASYVTIDGFESTTSARAGIGVRTMGDDTGADTRDDIVQNCYCHHNGLPSGGAHDGIFTGFALNFSALNNVCSNNGEHGIYVSNSADNPIVRGNTCSSNRACGIQLNADLSTGDGDQDGLISNFLIEDNILTGNGTAGGSAINLDGDINGIVRNNLIYNNLSTGIALYGIDGAQASNHDVVVNNTIYNPSANRAALLIADDANNNVAFNNILISHNGIEIDAATGFQHDYNVVSSFDGGAYSAHETNTAATALFTNVAGNDYHLSTTSPAKNTGVASFASKSAPTDDIEGNTRPAGGAYDLGCYEAAGAVTPVPPTVTVTDPAANAVFTPAGFAASKVDGTATDDSAVTFLQVKLFRTNAGTKEFWNGSAWVTSSVVAPITVTGLNTANVSWKVTTMPAAANLILGAYNVQAQAKDASNNSVLVTRPFTLASDSTKPVAFIDTPGANQHVLDSNFTAATITGHATDNIAVASVSVKLYRTVGGVKQFWNGTAWTTSSVSVDALLSGPVTNRSWMLDDVPSGADLTPGVYSIQAGAKDTANNSATFVTRNFYIDGTSGISAPIQTGPSGQTF